MFSSRTKIKLPRISTFNLKEIILLTDFGVNIYVDKDDGERFLPLNTLFPATDKYVIQLPIENAERVMDIPEIESFVNGEKIETIVIAYMNEAIMAVSELSGRNLELLLKMIIVGCKLDKDWED